MQQLKQHPYITNEFVIRKSKKVMWRMLDIILKIHARRRLMRCKSLVSGPDPPRVLRTSRPRALSALPRPLDGDLPPEK